MKFRLSVAAFVAAAGIMQAGIVQTPGDVGVSVGGGQYRWSWTLTLDGAPGDTVNSTNDDFAVIYDFYNYVPGSIFFIPATGGATWTPSTSNSGPYPVFSGPPVFAQDDADILNLVLTLTAGSLTINVNGDPIEIGEFGALSTSPYPVESLYASDGMPGSQNDFQPTNVPGVPEPTTMALAVSGLSALLVLRRKHWA